MHSVSRFSAISGLHPNPNKSNWYFCNVPQDTKHHALVTSGFQQDALPIKYLGLPLITTRLKAQDCSVLVQRLCWRIESWTSCFLRYSGRLQLLRSVLFGIFGYWSTHLFLPKNILNKIQACFSKFLWGGKPNAKCHHKVAWIDCCLPKLEGGLGISDLHERNKAAIFYQIWRISHYSDSSIWIQWFHKCLLKDKSFWAATIPSASSWAVRQILNHRMEARRFISFDTGVDSNLFMWHDPWFQNRPLSSRLGIEVISNAESTSKARIKDFIMDGRWIPPRSNHNQVIELRQILVTVPITRKDAVLWQGTKLVKLSTIWNSIRRTGTTLPWFEAVWHSLSIPKCAFFMWLALKRRLLTKDKMQSFGMQVNPSCMLCQGNTETVEHLFTSCPYSNLVLKCSPVPLNCTWNDWINGNFTSCNQSNWKKRIGWLFVSVMIYLVWQERNRRMHANGQPRPTIQLSCIIKNVIREKLFSCNCFQKQLAKDKSLTLLLY